MAFVPIAAGVVAVASAAPIARLVRNLRGHRLAILGGRKVGKTTLYKVLQDGVIPESPEPTITPKAGGSFSIDAPRKRVKFSLRNDLPGTDGLGYPEWHEAFNKAEYVWYLFRADLIAQRDKGEIDRVKEHFGYLNSWMTTKKRKVILVGTWADAHADFLNDPAKFTNDVASTALISVGALKLNNAQLVVGGLQVGENAQRLRTSLGERI